MSMLMDHDEQGFSSVLLEQVVMLMDEKAAVMIWPYLETDYWKYVYDTC